MEYKFGGLNLNNFLYWDFFVNSNKYPFGEALFIIMNLLIGGVDYRMVFGEFDKLAIRSWVGQIIRVICPSCYQNIEQISQN